MFGTQLRVWVPAVGAEQPWGVGRQIFTFNFAVLCIFFFLVIMHYITEKKSQGKKEKKTKHYSSTFPCRGYSSSKSLSPSSKS